MHCSNSSASRKEGKTGEKVRARARTSFEMHVPMEIWEEFARTSLGQLENRECTRFVVHGMGRFLPTFHQERARARETAPSIIIEASLRKGTTFRGALSCSLNFTALLMNGAGDVAPKGQPRCTRLWKAESTHIAPPKWSFARCICGVWSLEEGGDIVDAGF